MRPGGGAGHVDSWEVSLGSVLGHPPLSFATETVQPKELKRVGNKRVYFSKFFPR